MGKQLRIELDNGSTLYMYLRGFSTVIFDESECYIVREDDNTRSTVYSNLVPDAEAKYHAFIQDKKAKVLTLRERENNG